MYAISTHQFLYLPILGKQRHRRNRLVRQHPFEVFHQGETGTLDPGGSAKRALLGLLHKPLHGGFHGPEHQRRRGQPHHLQRTNGLMQLLPRNAQLAGINGCEVGATRQFGVAHKTLQDLGSAVQGFPKLIQHPGQGTEIIDSHVEVSGFRVLGVGLHKKTRWFRL